MRRLRALRMFAQDTHRRASAAHHGLGRQRICLSLLIGAALISHH